MRVILHIGAPKTGTSAIQFFLNENHKRLKQLGFYYPEHNFDPNNVSGGHASFGAHLVDENVADAASLLAQWLDEAKQNNCCLLLSAEAMYRRPEQVVELLSGYQTDVIAYFRHPLESLVSNHNQSIKRHYSTSTLDDFLYHQIGVNNRGVNGQVFFDWKELLKDNKFSVRPYHFPSFYKGRIELDFLKQIGIHGWKAKRFKLRKQKINTSYTEGALEIKRLLNDLLETENNRENIILDRVLQNFSDRVNNGNHLSKKLAINSKVYTTIVGHYEVPMQRMRDHLLQECPDDFMYPSTIVPLTDVTERRSLGDVIKSYQELCRQEPELMSAIEKRLQQKLMTVPVDRIPYALLKLAEITGQPFREPKHKSSSSSRALTELIDGLEKPEDYLREIGKWLEKEGDTEAAYQLICKAAAISSGNNKKQLLRLCERYEQRLNIISNAN